MTENFLHIPKTVSEGRCHIAIVGACGRMGARIAALIELDAEAVVIARFDRQEVPLDDGAKVDVVIDFSSDEGCRDAINIATRHNASLLVGTTALSAVSQDLLREYATRAAVMMCANTSLGVAVTRHLAREAARVLASAGWTVDIVETHHDRKVDAPSGTALAIAASLHEGGMSVPSNRIHAIRAGDTVGEHEIRLAGPFERITITHDAVSRDLFAAGAIRAAKWLKNRAPAFYSIEASLGIGASL
ncbi:MAG: 4-hydroxy-tetrahydrodipicolinate reductase [Phycisphaerales bacterium]|nr:4-hydroxy-tetrahydrodipicolinate reductase [Phycisphaerales bacterium]